MTLFPWGWSVSHSALIELHPRRRLILKKMENTDLTFQECTGKGERDMPTQTGRRRMTQTYKA